MVNRSLSSESHFAPPMGALAVGRDFGSFAIAERTYAAKLRIDKHSHAEAFFILPLAGSYTEVISGQEETCRRGMVLYRPVDVPHANIFHAHGACTLQIQLQPSMLEELKANTGIVLEMSTLLNPEALALAGRLREEFLAEPNEISRLMLDCLLMELLVEAHRRRPLPAPRKSTAVKRAADLLRSDLSGCQDLKEIARLVDLHPVQLCRDFRKNFHCTMGEYLLRCRVEKAKVLLLKSEQPLSEIGHQCGFYDQSHFTKSFKKLVKINPLEYRKSQVEMLNRAIASSGNDVENYQSCTKNCYLRTRLRQP